MLGRIKKNKWIRLAILLILFLVYSVTMTLCLGTACPFTLVTGFPCPACGMTRANLLALGLRFPQAFAMHPLFWVSVPAAAAVAVFTARPDWARNKWVSVCAVALTAAFIGVYVWRMVALYPDTTPMVYNYDSLLGLLRRWWGF